MTSTSGLSIKLCESPEELALCHAIRKEVFVDEQGFSLADEFDECVPLRPSASSSPFD